jgi:hypothetical protein
MIGKALAERIDHFAVLAAQRKADEKYAQSALGMHAAATQLRRDAGAMSDSNDRDAMLRLAASYDQRAGLSQRR